VASDAEASSSAAACYAAFNSATAGAAATAPTEPYPLAGPLRNVTERQVILGRRGASELTIQLVELFPEVVQLVHQNRVVVRENAAMFGERTSQALKPVES